MRKGSAKAEPFGILSFADMRLAAEDHVVHVAMTDVVFFLHCNHSFQLFSHPAIICASKRKVVRKKAMGIKGVADFHPQGVCGIRKAAKLLTAAQAAAHGGK